MGGPPADSRRGGGRVMGCGKSKPSDPSTDGLQVDNGAQALEFEYKFKLLFIGNSSVGKSSLLMRFADKSFPTEYMNTIGIDYKTHSIEVQGKSIKLQMWDTLGKSAFVPSPHRTTE